MKEMTNSQGHMWGSLNIPGLQLELFLQGLLYTVCAVYICLWEKGSKCVQRLPKGRPLLPKVGSLSQQLHHLEVCCSPTQQPFSFGLWNPLWILKCIPHSYPMVISLGSIFCPPKAEAKGRPLFNKLHRSC